MPRRIDTPMIIARFGDRVIGWAGNNEGGRLSGDAEWVENAKTASAANVEYTLYSGINLKADITDPENPAGAFAALAWFARERIIVKTAPAGMMESLGLLESPEEVDTFEGYSGEVTEEEREFVETHLPLTLDGEEVWVALETLKGSSSTPDLLHKFLKKMAEDEEETDSDVPDEKEDPENSTESEDEAGNTAE